MVERVTVTIHTRDRRFRVRRPLTKIFKVFSKKLLTETTSYGASTLQRGKKNPPPKKASSVQSRNEVPDGQQDFYLVAISKTLVMVTCNHVFTFLVGVKTS